MIRDETNDGYAIADFLARLMSGSSPGDLEYAHRDRVISPADRMAAAKELLNRGFGRLGGTRRSARQDDSDLVQSGLARYIRERTNHGMEAVRLLLDAASGKDDSFSMRQRVAATRELIRRGWDINYEAVTTADILAYYERQDAIEPTEHDIRLQEWLEQERAAHRAQVESREEEPQPEPGLFAHLGNPEVKRYESLTVQEQAEFVKRQRQDRASTQPAAAQPESAPAVLCTLTRRSCTLSRHSCESRNPHPQHTRRPQSRRNRRSHIRTRKLRLEHPNPTNHHPITNTPSCTSRSFPRPNPQPLASALPVIY